MQLGQGMVSRTYLQNGIVSKQYLTPFQKYTARNIKSHWDNEIKALEVFKGKKHFPQLINVDPANRIIYISYCGELLTKENLPKDWEKQCKEIEAILDEKKIYHIDLSEIRGEKKFHKNICVNKGIINLIDWGFWTRDKGQYTTQGTVHQRIKPLVQCKE